MSYGTCEKCGGASGHPPISAHSTKEAGVIVTGLRISRRPVQVCYPCIVRLGREARNQFAIEEAAIARRLLAIGRPNSASWLRHRSQHQVTYVPACEFCRLEEAA